MRRIALALVPILLAGCSNELGNPTVGAGKFLSDTFALRGGANRPVVESVNGKRVLGADVEVEPLLPESGNVWPGPLPPQRTMSDLQREQEGGRLPPIDSGLPPAGSTPASPVLTIPGSSMAPPPPPPSAIAPSQPSAGAVPAPRSRVLQTPSGPATTTIGSNGVETYTLPNGRTGIVMPNANGTLTLIGPDGTTTTIPGP
jgi:hypothetical protein